MEPHLFLLVPLLMSKKRPQTLGGLRGNANKCEGKALAVIIQRSSKHIKANLLCVCVRKVNAPCAWGDADSPMGMCAEDPIRGEDRWKCHSEAEKVNKMSSKSLKVVFHYTQLSYTYTFYYLQGSGMSQWSHTQLLHLEIIAGSGWPCWAPLKMDPIQGVISFGNVARRISYQRMSFCSKERI